ncbi:kinase-like domain-containing protein [Mycena vitilis]|nr:kinase-like domain-containing protein [Mycena vitilis]
MPTNRYGITDSLLSNELFWRDNFHFILEHGYQLRPRYHPEWIPSWRSEYKGIWAEDATCLCFHAEVIDATRCSDGTKIVLKRVDKHELAVIRELHALPPTPDNRTVPLLAVIPLPTPGEQLIVMPFMRHIFDPPFDRLSQVLDALHQLLTGLKFMHNNEIAHRDACSMNFVMDASKLVPGGWHFASPHTTPNRKRRRRARRRSSVKEVRYYIIDFGLSVFRCALETDPQVIGADRTVPEFKSGQPYDPYKLDIYQMGNMIKQEFIEKYLGLDILKPLVEKMTRTIPRERPTAAEALAELCALAEKYSKAPFICQHSAGRWRKRVITTRNKIHEKLCC